VSEATIKMPRLSESGFPPTWPRSCQRCGCVHERPIALWQEHDDADQREPIFVALCTLCADRVIEPHPRLYRLLDRHEPAIGVMRICAGCRHQVGGRCRSPLAKANGGEGLPFPAPDGTVHIQYADKRGRRCGKWLRTWLAEPTECKGYEPEEEL